MTIQQLQYVITVVETGSFSKAADECFVTQPTLSAQVRKLERELGTVLLDRSRKPVLPTESGRELLARGREALRLIRQIPETIHSREQEISGRMRVGIIPTLSQYLLPRFLKPFLAAHPRVRVQVYETLSDRIIDDLRIYKLDVGILSLPTGASGLEERSLFHEEFVGYFPNGYELSQGVPLPTVLTLGELRWEEMLLLAEGHCFRDQAVNICRRQEMGVGGRLEFETGSLESLKRLVEQGLGYTLLPELAVPDLAEEFRGNVRRLAEPRPTREIGALVHPGFGKRRLLAALETAIVDCLPPKVRANSGSNRVPWRGR
ncbi:MAG: hydrogen peroxide-inducible genes activator [Spirochaetota bacterium]